MRRAFSIRCSTSSRARNNPLRTLLIQCQCHVDLLTRSIRLGNFLDHIMASNLVRQRSLIVAFMNIRTHFTKSPSHHTKAKWRPFRRAKVLDVRHEFEITRYTTSVSFRSTFPISKRTGICVRSIYKSRENTSNVKASHRYEMPNTSPCTSTRRVSRTVTELRPSLSHLSRSVRSLRATRRRRESNADVTRCKHDRNARHAMLIDPSRASINSTHR